MAIEQKSINMNGVWEIATPLTAAKFKTEVDAFLADTTLGLAKNEQKKIEMKCPVYFWTSLGVKKGKILVYTDVMAEYGNLLDAVAENATIITRITGDADGQGAYDDEDEAFSANFSCKLGEDTFQINFHKGEVAINNYSDAATVTALETYFATRPNLAQTSA